MSTVPAAPAKQKKTHSAPSQGKTSTPKRTKVQESAPPPPQADAVDPEYVERLERSLRAAEAEQRRLTRRLDAMKLPETSTERPYHYLADKMMKGYVMLCLRSRYALEHEDVKGQRLIFEQTMSKITDLAEGLVRQSFTDLGYAMEGVDREKLYEAFCASKKKAQPDESAE